MTNNTYPKRDPEKIKELISLNFDSRQYFFSKADKTWLEWLWDNGLLDDLKKKADDVSQYSYRLPELEYLTRMAEEDPVVVADIIEGVEISKDTFNPEVIDRFFWIVGLLPPEQIGRLIPKILREDWNGLMSSFNKSGYEYQKIVEKLHTAKDFGSLVEFSRVVLTLRSEEELAKIEKFFISDKMFYLHDITQTGIFEALLDPENPRKEETLDVVLDVLSDAVCIGKDREENVFEESEPFYLPEIDIFTVRLETDNRSYLREDIQNLVATAKELSRELFTSSCGNEIEVRRLYDAYIAPLPDSQTLFKLRLFVITRCPGLFVEEIKNALFRVFNVGERYFEIENGAEYHNALLAGFGSLNEETKHEYISNVIEYFGKTLEDKDREGWRKRDGIKILRYIQSELTETEISKAEEVFGKFPEEEPEAPHPDVGHMKSGFVSHQSPVNLSDFSVVEIIEHFKSDWSPAVLQEQFKEDDFLRPRGSEGLGDALKEDFKNREDEYFDHLNDFFDRDQVDPGYIYALLRYIEDSLRASKTFTDDQLNLLFNFFDLIKSSGEENEFERSKEKSYFADWITVHKVMADILVDVLRVMRGSQLFKDNRDKILGIIKYLFTIESSPDAEDDEREAGEPFHVAINSTRGRNYEAFVLFAGDDSKELEQDVKDIFTFVLNNDTSNAVRFMVGHYLATFYFRDTSFIQGLLPEIFPKDKAGVEKAYFATWEGYLTNALYKELYEELKDYYAYAITLDKSDYPERKYAKGLDETLAGHLALAYAHFNLIPGDSLFDAFWNTPNETRHYEFASFIGRHYLTRDRAGDEWLQNEMKVSKDKLIDFWNWILTTDLPIEQKAFSGFGFWINPGKEIIPDEIAVVNMAKTLEKSGGKIDWEYGLIQRLPKFAEVNPEKTLEIIRNMVLLGDDMNPNYRHYFDAHGNFAEPLRTIYGNESMKKPVRDLINTFVSKGGRNFWSLKEIIEG